MPGGRRGPRSGEDTRGAILAAAREEFARAGFEGASLRGIARVAGVDPALVHHYFDGKADLFARAVIQVELPDGPAGVVESMVAVPPEELGATVVRTFLSLWDARPGTFEALFRSMAGGEEVARSVREFFVAEVARRVARAADPAAGAQELQLRAALFASQMVGLAMGRYVLRVPGLVDGDPGELVRRVGPVLQAYLRPGQPLAEESRQE